MQTRGIHKDRFLLTPTSLRRCTTRVGTSVFVPLAIAAHVIQQRHRWESGLKCWWNSRHNTKNEIKGTYRCGWVVSRRRPEASLQYEAARCHETTLQSSSAWLNADHWNINSSLISTRTLHRNRTKVQSTLHTLYIYILIFWLNTRYIHADAVKLLILLVFI